MTRIAVLFAGAIAMIAGACSFSWWRLTAIEGFGLREFHVCAFDTCKPYDYANAVGADADTWIKLGTVACYGAFVVAAVAVIAAFAWWQKTAPAVAIARAPAVLALAMIGVAIAFVLTRPEIFEVSESQYERASFVARSMSVGWSAIAYVGGAVAVVVASVLLSRRSDVRSRAPARGTSRTARGPRR